MLHLTMGYGHVAKYYTTTPNIESKRGTLGFGWHSWNHTSYAVTRGGKAYYVVYVWVVFLLSQLQEQLMV